ncbi:MAG: hypothetical protein HOI88_02580 [Phycisphaerae bacterium]|nr:hypothetical protein [Phycisphaerae bacterium]MBT5366006.1 hypothetical protein [Phycisphaerae bacterium]MBT6269220.1 hypothetical protein [Phycisphaerae bacterium]MBT6282937.1 hypothetical protein [Phycisphaerae bacterium]
MKLIAYFILLALTTSGVFGANVTLRSSSTPITGEILSGGKEGLRIQLDSEANTTTLVPWSSIRAIETAKPRPSLDALLENGKLIWRAKQRLIRGDVKLAEPIFESLFDTYKDAAGKDAQLICEGYLRCTLARGDLSRAFEPWIIVAQHRANSKQSSFSSLEPVVEKTSLLCKHLPPVPLVKQQFANLLLASGDYKLPFDADFVTLLIAVSNGELSAISTLNSIYKTLPMWKQIWANYFLGEGYLAVKNNAKARTKGLLYMAKVASLQKHQQPWLSGAALLRLSEEFAIDGDDETAEKMMLELHRNFPLHPLLTSKQKRNLD